MIRVNNDRRTYKTLFLVIAILAAGVLTFSPSFSKAAQAKQCGPNKIICAPTQAKEPLFIPGPDAVDTDYNISNVIIPVTNPFQLGIIASGSQVIFKYYNLDNHSYSERLLTFDNGGLYFYNIFGVTGLAINAHYLNISYTLGEDCPVGYRCSDDPPANTASLLVQDKNGQTIKTLLVPFWTFDANNNSLIALRVLG